jgi:hypothetical protein
MIEAKTIGSKLSIITVLGFILSAMFPPGIANIIRAA